MKNVYILTEEFEGTEGVREFQILNASDNLLKLKNIMQGKVEEDEYGLFRENGINRQDDFCVESNYTSEGFIGYSITVKELI